MTLTLEQVAGWLLQQDAELEGRVTVGAIDANYDRCVGVYNDNRASGGQRICIGGEAYTRYAYKYVTLLVHWTTNPSAAEKKAIELYESSMACLISRWAAYRWFSSILAPPRFQSDGM